MAGNVLFSCESMCCNNPNTIGSVQDMTDFSSPQSRVVATSNGSKIFTSSSAKDHCVEVRSRFLSLHLVIVSSDNTAVIGHLISIKHLSM